MLKRYSRVGVGLVLVLCVAMDVRGEADVDPAFSDALQQLDRDALIMLCTNLQGKINQLERGISAQAEAKLKEYRTLIADLQRENAELKGRLGKGGGAGSEASRAGESQGGDASAWIKTRSAQRDTTWRESDKQSQLEERKPAWDQEREQARRDEKVDAMFGAMNYRSVSELFAVIPSGVCPKAAEAGETMNTTYFDKWVNGQLIGSVLESEGRVHHIEEGDNVTTIWVTHQGHGWHDLTITRAMIGWVVPNDDWPARSGYKVGQAVRLKGELKQVALEPEEELDEFLDPATQVIARIRLRDVALARAD